MKVKIYHNGGKPIALRKNEIKKQLKQLCQELGHKKLTKKAKRKCKEFLKDYQETKENLSDLPTV